MRELHEFRPEPSSVTRHTLILIYVLLHHSRGGLRPRSGIPSSFILHRLTQVLPSPFWDPPLWTRDGTGPSHCHYEVPLFSLRYSFQVRISHKDRSRVFPYFLWFTPTTPSLHFNHGQHSPVFTTITQNKNTIIVYSKFHGSTHSLNFLKRKFS